MPEFVTVCKVGKIPNGEGRAFEVNEQMVAVFNNDGEYLAIDDMCPHMGASLASGFFEADDCTVTCPWHAWRFDTRDGTWCDNRRLKIDVYQVRVVGDEIQVAPVDPVEESKTDESKNDESKTDESKTDEDATKEIVADPEISHPLEADDDKN